ncbi:MAG: hypothetical protein FWD61_06590 [Phycisphaerales bacterium]|nr:hypothetical protein [Phycisphaerales bacterium]
MRGGKRLLAIFSLMCLATPLLADDPADPSQAATERARKFLAQRMVNDAIVRSRQSSAPGVADEAAILIQTASSLDPDNTRLLRMLAEAARASSLPNKIDIERDALKNVIRLDHDDLVSQVAYFDLVAGATQAIDLRARIYRAALDSESLDPQVRSEMAVRLSKIAAERGDADSAKGFLTQALTLNDVNVSALAEAVKLADPTPQAKLQANVALLAANPLQPEAWVEAAAALSTGGAHARAADCLVTAIDQWNTAGKPLAAEIVQTAGQELAIANQLAQAQPYLMMTAQVDGAPLSALVAARVLATEYAPIAKPATATSPAMISADDLNTLIRTRLRQSVAANPKNAQPFAEAAWIELSCMPDVFADTPQWISSYAALVPANDPTLLRLKAWQLLRDGKLDESRAALEKLIATTEGGDPLSQLGLVRIALQQNNRDVAAKQFQQLWNNQPTGLLAMQVAQAARLVHIALADPPAVRQLAQMLAKLPANAMTMHRSPRDFAVITGTFTQRSYNQGEPVLLNVRITNNSGRPAPVGPNGLIKTNMGILAGSRGIAAQNLGLIGIEDIQRCYRLTHGASTETQIRVDQGPLADRFQSNPLPLMTIAISLVSNPQNSGNNLIGLGGQLASAGIFDRNGEGIFLGLSAIPGIIKRAQDAAGLTVDNQMLLTDLFLRLLDSFPEQQPESTPADAKAQVLEVRKAMLNVIKGFVGSSSPEVRAWTARVVPTQGIPQEILERIDKLESDASPVVRMMWGIRQIALSTTDAESRQRSIDALTKHAAAESDPVLQHWFKTLAKDMSIPAPTTAPAPKP